jgi:hypothetical protein
MKWNQVFSLAVFVCTPAWATEGLRTIPNFFYDVPLMTIDDVVLQRTCWSLPAGSRGLSCNPAHLANEEKRQLRLNLSVDQHADDVSDLYQMVRHDDSVALVDKLLNEDGPTVARAFTNVWYQHDNWALAYTPMRLAFASRVRNRSYPEIATHLKKESELSARAGFFVADIPRLRVGLQARYLSQEFLRQDFALLDAIADPEILEIEEYRTLILEPGMAFTFEGALEPTLSAGVTNIEVYRNGSKRAETIPIGEMGFSITHGLGSGRVISSLHISMLDEVNTWRFLRLGTRYSFENFSLFSSIARGDYGIGVSATINSLVLGAAYKLEEVGIGYATGRSVNTLMGEVGLQF